MLKLIDITYTDWSYKIMGILEVAIGVSAITGVAGLKASSDARSEQRKAQRAQAKIQERQTQRQRIQSLREARVKQGQLGVQATNSGTQDTSAVQGASASLQQNLGSNLSFVEQVQGLQRNVQYRQEQASKYAGQAQAFSAVSGLALQGASMAGGSANTAPTDGSISVYQTNF